MKPWIIICNYKTGEPTGQLVCGECFNKSFKWFDGEVIRDPSIHYSDSCSICGKSCGDYFIRKEAA